MTETHCLFREAIRAAGLEPPAELQPGTIHRFPGFGKNPGNKAGWCLLFEDGAGGCFGDWSCGLSTTWFAESNTSRANVALAKQARNTRKAIRHTLDARHTRAARRAQEIWRTAPAAPENHGYLATRGVRPQNARLHRQCLVLPITTFTGAISSLQFIAPDGTKRLLRGGRKQGCFIAVNGDETQAQRIVICEGWATGCTLAAEKPSALVLAAIDAGNLCSVAMSARHRWPIAELVVAGDDDRCTEGNPGATKAREAALASGAQLALPQWPERAPKSLTDFNDLARWLAGDSV